MSRVLGNLMLEPKFAPPSACGRNGRDQQPTDLLGALQFVG